MNSECIGGQTIEGVELKKLDKHKDPRGAFTEVFQNYWGTVLNPCQWSVVHSEENVFRGCHLHLRHDEYFCLIEGEASVGLRDERPDSPTYGNWQLYHLYADDMAAVVFPVGLVHGWYFHKKSIHLQAVSESYLDYGADDNFGVMWNDPALEIPWEIDREPILAPRAAGFGDLASMRAATKAALQK